MSVSLTVRILGYPFVCYPLEQVPASDAAAVYVILTIAPGAAEPHVIDVGATRRFKTRLDGHERRSCWEEVAGGRSLWVGVYFMPGSRFAVEDRRDIERSVRQVYMPPCGKGETQ